jgi:uncharacterized protein
VFILDCEIMNIDLRTISSEGAKHLELILEDGWWQQDKQDDQIEGIAKPIVSKVDIYKAGDKFVLEGDMAGAVSVRCDRCLAAFEKGIKTGFKLFFTPPARYDTKAEIELLEEDLETGFINGEEINLDDIFREQLYLSLPIKSLCKEECLGLCPVCGTDLNIQACKCEKRQP